MEKIIDVKNLNKSFGDVHAVKDLSFHVKQGSFLLFSASTERENPQRFQLYAVSSKRTAER